MMLQQAELPHQISFREKPNFTSLVQEAAPHIKEFFGVRADYPLPGVALDQGKSVIEEGRACYDKKANVVCFPSHLGIREAIRTTGHEVGHWLHEHDNNGIEECMKEIAEEGRNAPRSARPNIVARLSEFRNLQEFIAALSSLVFSELKGELEYARLGTIRGSYRGAMLTAGGVPTSTPLKDFDSLAYSRTISAALDYEIIRSRDPSERRELLLAPDLKSLYRILRIWNGR